MSDSKKQPFTLAMKINTRSETTGEALREQQDKPFCVAMMGNFSGRQGVTEEATISARHFVEIDRYNYDEVLASMKLQLSLLPALDNASPVNVPLHSLKDFHPDNLYKNVDAFGELRQLRDQLKNPQTFHQAMQELGLPLVEDEVAAPQDSETAEKLQPQSTEKLPEPASGGRLIDSILEETESRSRHSAETSKAQAQGTKSLVDTLIQQLVAHKRNTVSRDPRQQELVASIDEQITLLMRSLLHNPKFQALEALWRGVHFMVKRIPGNRSMKLYLFDVNREELALNLDVDDVTQSALYKQFCDTSPGDIDWSLIIGDYRFGADIDDILLLSQLGIIAHQAGAQFIAAADENLVGCPSFATAPGVDDWQHEISQPVSEAWALLRKSPVAKHICLALPRFMLRAPYGRKATPVKAFAFEEMSEPCEHEEYLWGNPAFLKAEQIARAFIENGWELHYANVMKTEDLPLHYYQQDGRTIVKPCAEIPLTDSGASKMIAQGLIPLWSVKNSDRVHSGDFHSIAE